jgi:hypothetical protein
MGKTAVAAVKAMKYCVVFGANESFHTPDWQCPQFAMHVAIAML